MALLFKSDADRAELWVPAIRARLPEMEVRVWPDLGDPDEIEYTLIWKPRGLRWTSLPCTSGAFVRSPTPWARLNSSMMLCTS